MKIVFDPKLCTLCGNCMQACAGAHDGVPRLKIERDDAGIQRYQCRQCAKPACAYACTYDLIYRNKQTGAIEVELEECQACHACVRACPFHAVLVHPETDIAWICDLCGGSPKCTQSCPVGALSLSAE